MGALAEGDASACIGRAFSPRMFLWLHTWGFTPGCDESGRWPSFLVGLEIGNGLEIEVGLRIGG
jgi:hypothetical protein